MVYVPGSAVPIGATTRATCVLIDSRIASSTLSRVRGNATKKTMTQQIRQAPSVPTSNSSVRRPIQHLYFRCFQSIKTSDRDDTRPHGERRRDSPTNALFSHG